MRETCGWRCVSQSVLVFWGRMYCHGSQRKGCLSGMLSYFVVRLNVELDLLASQGAHSTRLWLAAGCGVEFLVLLCSLDLHVVWFVPDFREVVR
jgi:hypothetical protein